MNVAHSQQISYINRLVFPVLFNLHNDKNTYFIMIYMNCIASKYYLSNYFPLYSSFEQTLYNDLQPTILFFQNTLGVALGKSHRINSLISS